MEGPTNALDDCGNHSSALDAKKGTSLGASYDFGNGFKAALGYEGQGNSSSGLATLEGEDAYGGQIAYSSDMYGISFTYGLIQETPKDANGTPTGAPNTIQHIPHSMLISALRAICHLLVLDMNGVMMIQLLHQRMKVHTILLA